MRIFRETIVVLAAVAFVWAGIAMATIRSVAGGTVNEAFYNAVGFMSFGFAGLTLVLGFTTYAREQARTDPKDFKRCVECNEMVWKVATKCPYCGTDLIEEESDEAGPSR